MRFAGTGSSEEGCVRAGREDSAERQKEKMSDKRNDYLGQSFRVSTKNKAKKQIIPRMD